jgi:hypothetical protein
MRLTAARSLRVKVGVTYNTSVVEHASSFTVLLLAILNHFALQNTVSLIGSPLIHKAITIVTC